MAAKKWTHLPDLFNALPPRQEWDFLWFEASYNNNLVILNLFSWNFLR
jgi:hypothetical protein